MNVGEAVVSYEPGAPYGSSQEILSGTNPKWEVDPPPRLVTIADVSAGTPWVTWLSSAKLAEILGTCRGTFGCWPAATLQFHSMMEERLGEYCSGAMQYYQTAATAISPFEEKQVALNDIRATCFGVQEEDIESGEEGVLSRAIIRAIKTYGKLAIEAMGDIIQQREVEDWIAAEVLRWLGYARRMVPCYEERRRLLEECLWSGAPLIRDRAGLGLAFLGDRHALPCLQAAVEHEKSPVLRQNLKEAMRQIDRG